MLGVIALTGAWDAANAQTIPRVTLTVEAAVPQGGPGPDLESTLRAAGLAGESFGGGFFGTGPVHHPYTDEFLGWSADLRVRVRPRLTVGFSAGRSNAGSTYGHNGAFLNALDFQADYSVTTIAPVITWHPDRRLRLGAGPALQRATFASPQAGVDIRKNMLGWTAQAGLAFFDGRRLFSEIAARYHGMGTVGLSDVTLNGTSFMAEPAPSIVIPAMDVTFSHWSIGVTLGVKFQ